MSVTSGGGWWWWVQLFTLIHFETHFRLCFTKGVGTFCGCFGPIRKQRQFRVKLSAIVGSIVSSHSCKFQPDRPYFYLTLVLNQIRPLVIRLGDETSYFWKDIFLVLSLTSIPSNAELNSPFNTGRWANISKKYLNRLLTLLTPYMCLIFVMGSGNLSEKFGIFLARCFPDCLQIN
jgi:hypothetical protein